MNAKEWTQRGLEFHRSETSDGKPDLEQAVSCYRRALSLTSKNGEPRRWARLHWFMAMAVRDLRTGNNRRNENRAIALAEHGLTAITSSDARDYYELRCTLGVIYER